MNTPHDTYDFQGNSFYPVIGEDAETPLNHQLEHHKPNNLSFLDSIIIEEVVQNAELLQANIGHYSSEEESIFVSQQTDILEEEGHLNLTQKDLHLEQNIFWLNLEKATDINYDRSIQITGIESPEFEYPSHLQGREEEIITSLMHTLEEMGEPFGLQFTLEKPLSDTEYSTIYLGGDGADFQEYGTYIGLAEKIDHGNQDKNDIAFVFTDNIPLSQQNAREYGQILAYYVAHEAGHLVGFEHEHTPATDDPLAEVAFKLYTHVEIGKDVREDLINDGMLTIEGQSYSIHPKILSALENHDDQFKIGQTIIASGFKFNDGDYRIIEINDQEIVVDKQLENGDDIGTGNEQLIHKGNIAFTGEINLTVDTVNNSFKRSTGSFIEDGFLEGQTITTLGFNNNKGNYIISNVTNSELAVEETLNQGDSIGDGDEQLITQGNRGFAINGFLLLRDELNSLARSRGEREELSPILENVIDKLVTGQSIPNSTLNNLFTAYLYTWVDNIELGLSHWPEVGLAYTKAFADAQSLRDLQNKEGASKGLDTLENVRREEAEAEVGILDVIIEELEDPNGDGSIEDSFINQYLLPMFGLPKEFGVIRTISNDIFNSLNDLLDPIRDLINPILNPIAYTLDEIETSVKEWLKDQINERFGFDVDVFDFLQETQSKMGLASLTIAGQEFPIFKPGDSYKIDNYLGIDHNTDHQEIPDGFKFLGGNNVLGFEFYADAKAGLKDNVSFSKENFAAYANSVTLSKLLLLQEIPIDGDTLSTDGLSEVISDILTAQNSGQEVTYDFARLNLNGNHGGNILTATLPRINDKKHWLNSIDDDHIWRQDSLTSKTILYRVNIGEDPDSKAIWTAENIEPGNYQVQVSWLGNVTQTIDQPDGSEEHLSPASEANYTIYDGIINDGNIVKEDIKKDQKLFSGDVDVNGLSFANLGEFTINSGTINIELENAGDGNIIAGPLRLVNLNNNTEQFIQLERDLEDLTINPSGYSEILPNTWVDLNYETGTGNFPLWESEKLRPVFKELFIDWQNDGIPFPDLGDETSDDPNNMDNQIIADPLPSHATVFGSKIPETQISIPIPDSLKTIILEGLEDFVNFVDELDNSEVFQIQLPIVDQTLAEILNLKNNVVETFKEPIETYFMNDATPTIAELLEALGDGVTGRINSFEPILEFDIDLQKIISLPPETFFAQISNLIDGFTIDTSATIDLSAVLGFVDELNSRLPKFTLGIDLSSNDNLSGASDRFFIKADQLTTEVGINATQVNLNTNYKDVVNAGIENGTIELTGVIDFDFNDPNEDGRLTLREINEGINNVTDFISISSSGEFEAILPLNILNNVLTTQPNITIKYDNIFDGSLPNVEFNNFEQFNQMLNLFSNLNSNNIREIIQELAYGIESLSNNLNPSTGIPFVDQGIEEIIDLSELILELERNLAENSIIGKNIDNNNLIFNEDAVFFLQLNEQNNNIGIRIKQEITQDNQTISDLIDDINVALERAGLNNTIEAIERQNQVVLRSINLNDVFTIIDPNSVTINNLGLNNEDKAEFSVLAFNNNWSLLNILPDENKIVLKIDLDQTFINDINLDFSESIETGIGDINFIGGGSGNVEAEANLNLEFVLDFNAFGSDLEFTENTSLSDLDNYPRIVQKEGNDVQIRLKDGTEAEIDFDEDKTIGDVINSITNILGDNITVNIDNENKSLNLQDNTNGNGQFSITAINGSLTGLSLGILGTNLTFQGTVIGSELTPETLISDLNSATELNINNNFVSWRIKTKDKKSYTINFSLNSDTTLDEIFQKVESKTQRKVTLSIDGNTNKIVLRDNSIGNKSFQITANNNNGTTLGNLLGILQQTSSRIIQGNVLSENALIQPYLLNSDTNLINVNVGNGVDINPLANAPDVAIHFRDGSRTEIDLDVTETTTIQDIINKINLETNGKVIITINSESNGLVVQDNTIGNNPFMITNLEESSAATDLGIQGISDSGIITGSAINRILDESTPFSIIHQILTQTNIQNPYSELQINLRDGNSFEVDFKDNNSMTLQDVFNQIETASEDENENNRVLVTLNEERTSLVILDLTSGNNPFSIEEINNTSILENLGLDQLKTSNTIIGSSLHRDSWTNHLFLTNNSQIDVNATITSNDMNLSAGLGFLKVGVEEGSADFNFGVALSINGNEDVSLSNILDDFSTNTEIDYTTTGDINLPIIIEGLDLFGINPPSDLGIVVSFDENNPFRYNINLPNLNEIISEQVQAAKNLSTDDIISLVINALEFLENENLSLFNKEIPIIDKSINELLTFLDPIREGYTRTIEDIKNLKSNLLEDINTLENRIFEPALFVTLTPNLSQEVGEIFNILSNAINELPTSLDELSLEIPQNLINAVIAFEELIAELPKTAINDIITQLENTFNNLPDTIEETAKNKLEEIINEIKIDPSLIEENFNDLKIAILNLIDPAISINLSQLTTVFIDLERATNNSTKDIPQLLDNLDSIIDSLDNVDSINTIDLEEARDTISEGIDSIDLTLLQEGLTDLNQAIANLLTPELRQIFEEFEITLSQLSGNFANDIFEIIKSRIPTIDNLEDFIFNIFGISSPEGLSISLNDENDLIFNFDWNNINTSNVPLSLNLENGNSYLPLNFNTNGNLDVESGITLDLDLGFNLLNEGSSIYLLPSTQLELEADIDVSNFEADVSIGGISAITLGENGTGQFSLKDEENAAKIVITLDDNNSDGKILISEIPDSLDLTANGEINLDLPITVLNNNIGSITANADINDLENLMINYPPDLINQLQNAVLDYNIFEGGFEAFLDRLQNILYSEILRQLPFIGDELDTTNFFITDLRMEFLNPLMDILNDPQGFAAEEIQELIWDNLGVPGLNILRDNDDDNNNDTTIDDVIVAFDGNDELKIDLKLSNMPMMDMMDMMDMMESNPNLLHSNFDFDFDIEELQLGLEGKGGVNIELDYEFDLIVGINKTEGFFWEISDETEFIFDLDVSLSDGTNIRGELFFLELEANNTVLNEESTGKDYNQDGDMNDTLTTGFAGQLTLDIISSVGDNKITINELNTLEFDVELDTNATLALHLDLGTTSDDLPSIETDLLVYSPLTFDSQFESNLIISLNNIQFNAGEFIQDTIGSFVQTVNTYIEPIRPILDFLTTEIPVVSDLSELVGLGKITTLDALRLYGEGADTAADVLEIVAAIDEYLRRIKEFNGELIFEYGDYSIIPGENTNANLSLFSNQSQLNTQIQAISEIPTLINELEDELGLKFPIFEFDAGDIVNYLLFGQPSELIQWMLPSIDAEFTYRYRIPIFPPYPIFATIGARLDLMTQLSMGLNTRGLQTGKFLDGFYFSDHRESKSKDNPELTLEAAFSVGAEVNIGVTEFGVEGGVQANVFTDWHDPDQDGRLYFDEIQALSRRHWLEVLDFSGEVGAFFDAYVKIKPGEVTIYENRIPLFYTPLYQFGDAAETDPPQSPLERNNIPSTLGHYSTGVGEDEGIEEGTLIIHTGRFANLRQPGASQDAAEQLYITRLNTGAIEVHSSFLTDYRNLSSDPHPTGTIQVFGDDENEPFVTDIYIDGGQGDDYIEIDDLVVADLIIFGGNGNDTILAGMNTTSYVEGGLGNDTITAGVNNDTLIGGLAHISVIEADGKDNIRGNGGHDIVFGDHGLVTVNEEEIVTAIESLLPEGGDDDVIITSDGNDTVIGGAGDDFISATLNNMGNDILLGDSGMVALENETVTQITSTTAINGGNDTILAGIGEDTVMGGDRNDLITNDNDNSDDTLYGDQGYWDQITLNSMTAETDGDDEIYGTGGNDIIMAGGAKDYIESGDGLDIVFGDDGQVQKTDTGEIIRIETITSSYGDDDIILAGNDDDTVFGGPKNDRITGDETNNGDDILVGDQGYWTPDEIVSQFDETSNPDGNDVIYGNGGNDTILGSDGRDNVSSDRGLDIIVGDYGRINHLGKTVLRINTIESEKGNDDFLHGGNDDDTIIGGTANDSLVGGVDGGEEILIGDNGTVVNNDESQQSNDIFTHSPLYGGLDRIAGGLGDDTIIGGSGGLDTTNPNITRINGLTGDGLAGHQGDDIIIGDNAYISRNAQETIEKIETIFPDHGGDDYSLGYQGHDRIMGGFGKDLIFGHQGQDIILGDNGIFDYSLDNDLNTLNLVMATHVTLGDDDMISGNQDQDLIMGGTHDDDISGGDNHDLIFGDHGKVEGNIDLTFLPLTQINAPFTFEAIATGPLDLGGNDTIEGNEGDDIILGQQGDDDLIGGHTIAGRHDGNDTIDGGAGYDVIAGDNAVITPSFNNQSPRYRVLIGTILYDEMGNPLVTPDSQPNPQDSPERTIRLLDHNENTNPATYGNDSIAGGDDNDLIFGQLGDDTLQGDSSIITVANETLSSVDGDNDGDDYLEGGGGNDVIFGNLGQDDIIGGSSSLFGNLTSDQRPNGKDTIFGGSQAMINSDPPTNDLPAEDADVIVGDNGNIFRIVGINGENTGGFLDFDYSDYDPLVEIVPRVLKLLDYDLQKDE